MMSPLVTAHEIYDGARDDAVDEVPGRPADDESQSSACQSLMMCQAGGVPGDPDQRGRGDNRNGHRLERKIDAVEKPKRGSRIPDVREVHETRDHRDSLVQR